VGRDQINLVERAGLAIAATCSALLVILAILDVTSLGLKFYLASELSGFVMGWLIFFALPVVTRRRAHITVDFLVNAVPARVRTWIELLGQVATLVYVVALIALCGRVTYQSFADGLRAQGILLIPTFYPFLGIVIGMALMLMSQARVLMATVDVLRRGGPGPTNPG
jgi:TRAP-type C4-dicarboxylate transport system permease small subunit